MHELQCCSWVMLHATCCKRDVAHGNMRYSKCRNVRARLKALAEVPPWYKYEDFFIIARGSKGTIFPAMRNEITIAMRYNIT